MFKAYAKVQGETVIKYPYGFDDLQADLSTPIAGQVSFVDLFAQTQAFTQGQQLVEVTKDERRSVPLNPGQALVYGDSPVLFEGNWIIPLTGLDNPPQRPQDGKFYRWNIETRQWVEIPANQIPGG